MPGILFQINFYSECPEAFRKPQINYNETTRTHMSMVLSNHVAKQCNKKCRDSKDCLAYLIIQNDDKSDSKGNKIDCMFYTAKCKDGNNEEDVSKLDTMASQSL